MSIGVEVQVKKLKLKFGPAPWPAPSVNVWYVVAIVARPKPAPKHQFWTSYGPKKKTLKKSKQWWANRHKGARTAQVGAGHGRAPV